MELLGVYHCKFQEATCNVSKTEMDGFGLEKKIEGTERGGGWIDNRIILCFVWGRVSKQ